MRLLWGIVSISPPFAQGQLSSYIKTLLCIGEGNLGFNMVQLPIDPQVAPLDTPAIT